MVGEMLKRIHSRWEIHKVHQWNRYSILGVSALTCTERITVIYNFTITTAPILILTFLRLPLSPPASPLGWAKGELAEFCLMLPDSGEMSASTLRFSYFNLGPAEVGLRNVGDLSLALQLSFCSLLPREFNSTVSHALFPWKKDSHPHHWSLGDTMERARVLG